MDEIKTATLDLFAEKELAETVLPIESQKQIDYKKDIGKYKLTPEKPVNSEIKTFTHEYNGPHGEGYIVYFVLTKDKKKYVKYQNYGKEPIENCLDWELLDSEII